MLCFVKKWPIFIFSFVKAAHKIYIYKSSGEEIITVFVALSGNEN